MPNYSVFLIGVGVGIGLCLGLAVVWLRLQRLLADNRADNAAALAAMELRITERALGMMRNIAETNRAEPVSLHPMGERKEAEAGLFELARQRADQEHIARAIDGKQQDPK
jgi:hypothetical protein